MLHHTSQLYNTIIRIAQKKWINRHCKRLGHIKSGDCCDYCVDKQGWSTEPKVKMIINEPNYIPYYDVPTNIKLLISDVTCSDKGKARAAKACLLNKFEEIDNRRLYNSKMIIDYWMRDENIECMQLFDVNVYDVISEYQFRDKSFIFDDAALTLTIQRYISGVKSIINRH